MPNEVPQPTFNLPLTLAEGESLIQVLDLAIKHPTEGGHRVALFASPIIQRLQEEAKALLTKS